MLVRLSLMILLFAALTRAQTVPDSAYSDGSRNSQPFLNTQYDKQLVTYLFINKFNYIKSFRNINFSIYNNFTSTITSLNSKLIKDEEETEISTSYKVSHLFTPGINLLRISQNDNRNVELNASSLNRYNIFLTSTPAEYVTIKAFTGYSQHKQVDEYNAGYYYGTEAMLSQHQLENLTLDGYINLNNEDIMPRRNHNRILRLGILNTFPEAITTGFSADYTKQRRDFYIAADPNIASLYDIRKNVQTRNEEKSEFKGFANSGKMFSNIIAEGDFTLYYRTVDRAIRYKPAVFTSSSGLSSELNAFRLDLNSAVSANLHPFFVRFRVGFNQHEEKSSFIDEPTVDEFLFQQFNRKEQEKNFSAERISIGTSLLYSPADGKSLSIEATHQKLVYNTPSELNYDDRDELMSLMRIVYDDNSSAEFRWSAGIEGYLSKNAYLFAQRSANNNLNRFIKYFAANSVRYKGIYSKNYFEVSALYTVFEFADLLPNYRSLSFRQFLFTDSTTIPLKGAFALQTDFSVKLGEQGVLYWETFSTNPERYVTEFLFSPKIAYSHFNLRAYVGYRLLIISLYRFNNGIRNLSENYNSSGPVVMVRYDRQELYVASFQLFQEYLKTDKTDIRVNSNINMAVQWFF